MTPRELIEMLSNWEQDEPFETLIQNHGVGDQVAILAQGANTINLSEED